MHRSFLGIVLICSGALGWAQTPDPAQNSQPAAPATGQAAPEAAPAPTFATAQELAAKGRLDKAMEVLDQLAAQTPEPAGVERLRGIIFYQKEQLSQAVDAFTKAAAQDPERPRIDRDARREPVPHGPPGRTRFRFSKRRTHRWRGPTSIRNTCWASVTPTWPATMTRATPLPPNMGLRPTRRRLICSPDGFFCAARCADQAAVQAGKALELNPSLPLAHELLGEVGAGRGRSPRRDPRTRSGTQNQPARRRDLRPAGRCLPAQRPVHRGAAGAESRGSAGAELDRPLHSAGTNVSQAEAAHPGAALS